MARIHDCILPVLLKSTLEALRDTRSCVGLVKPIQEATVLIVDRQPTQLKQFSARLRIGLADWWQL